MSAFEDRIRSRVVALTAPVGKKITYRRITRTSGPNPTETSTDYEVTARVGAFPLRLQSDLIKGSDLLVILPGSAISFDPTTADSLVINGEEMTIVNIMPEYIAEGVGLWRIQAR